MDMNWAVISAANVAFRPNGNWSAELPGNATIVRAMPTELTIVAANRQSTPSEADPFSVKWVFFFQRQMHPESLFWEHTSI